MLVLGTYRPVEILGNGHPLRAIRQELTLHHCCEEFRLRELSAPEVEDYLSQRAGSDNVWQCGALAPLIHARTDGHPLFVVNMVDYLLEYAGFGSAQELRGRMG